MTRTYLLLLVTLGCAHAACSGDAIDIGDRVTGSALADYAGSWDGYAEAYRFRGSMSDRVRINIDPMGQGTIEFGDEPLLAPATDPDVGYPLDFFTRFPNGEWARQLTSGFRYPIHGAEAARDHLNLGVVPHDLYSDWCALQTSYAYSSTEDPESEVYFSCLLINSTRPGNRAEPVCYLLNPQTQIEVPIDCAKLALCGFPGPSSPCACNETACASQVPTEPPVRIAVDLDALGDELTGTLLVGMDRIAIKLRRD
jgi:hypothetical protein